MIKLNLGCSIYKLHDFINIDITPLITEATNGDYDIKPDVVADVRKLPYPDNYADFIYAGHLLEHFRWKETKAILKEWQRVLKVGGKLCITVPDCKWGADKFAKGEIDFTSFYAMIWGQENTTEAQEHKMMYDKEWLENTVKQLNWAKFEWNNWTTTLPDEIKDNVTSRKDPHGGISPVEWQLSCWVIK